MMQSKLGLEVLIGECRSGLASLPTCTNELDARLESLSYEDLISLAYVLRLIGKFPQRERRSPLRPGSLQVGDAMRGSDHVDDDC